MLLMINIDEDYISDDMRLYDGLFSGNSLFLRYWYMSGNPFYTLSALPGKKEGISGSTIGGYNIGIINYLPKEQEEAAVVALKYLTSKEVQKYLVTKNKVISAIFSLYDEKEVCETENVDCNLFKNLQPIGRIAPNDFYYDSYSEQLRSYLYNFIKGDNVTISDTIKNIVDITKIYYISAKSHDSPIGLINEIFILTLSLIIVLSLIFLFIDKVNSNFYILPFESWFISVIGVLIIIFTSYTEIGEISVLKCHSKLLMLSLGFTFNLIPVLYKLVVNFPDENKISKWVYKHQILFFLIFVIFDLILVSLSFIQPYIVEDNIIRDGENFRVCKMNHILTKVVVGSIIGFKLLVLLAFMILIFIEWSIQESHYDVRFLTLAIYIDTLFIILMVLIQYLEINNYISYFIIREFLYIFVSLTNYSCIYAYRIVFGIVKNKNKKLSFIKKINKDFINSFNITKSYNGALTSTKDNNSKIISTMDSSNNSDDDKGNTSSTLNNRSRLQLIINYHYRQYSASNENCASASANSTDNYSFG